MPSITTRSATADDVPLILEFIRALARFEKEPDAVKTTPADLLRDGFGEQPQFEVLIAERDEKPVGFALFFTTYSTWEGRPSLYLEDLFVIESARKHGAGRALMARLAAICVERGYQRLELQVLDWNPAREFYHRLGMVHMNEWLPYRLSGQALHTLAAGAKPA
jgi:GNAT superfamily N-acetyltransferase